MGLAGTERQSKVKGKQGKQGNYLTTMRADWWMKPTRGPILVRRAGRTPYRLTKHCGV
jgi:hypothetical protein